RRTRGTLMTRPGRGNCWRRPATPTGSPPCSTPTTPTRTRASLTPFRRTWHWAWYCNERAEKLAKAADALVRPEQAKTRAERYQAMYRLVMADAPWIPIFNERRYTMRSARLSGSVALFVDPIHLPVD